MTARRGSPPVTSALDKRSRGKGEGKGGLSTRGNERKRGWAQRQERGEDERCHPRAPTVAVHLLVSVAPPRCAEDSPPQLTVVVAAEEASAGTGSEWEAGSMMAAYRLANCDEGRAGEVGGKIMMTKNNEVITQVVGKDVKLCIDMVVHSYISTAWNFMSRIRAAASVLENGLD
ncbi:unnamed protein product [Closterium sp. Yama58-4]|nr:unnamed protein product [Closterium sp. Yama58-4]